MRSLLTLLAIFMFQFAFTQISDLPFDDLPPAPEDGKCYAKCKLPDRYETVTVQKLKKAGTSRVVKSTAKYRTETERIMIQEASVKYIHVPATYRTVDKQILSKAGHCKKKIIPAQYSYESTGRTLVSEASGRWVRKKKDPNCFSKNPEDCFILCWEEVPAQYSTNSQRSLVSEEQTVTEQVGAEYKTIKIRVIDQPATTKTVEIPAKYKTYSKRVLVDNDCVEDRVVSTPDQYTTTTQKRLVSSGGYTGWVEILCAANTTDSVVRDVQKQLNAKGYSVGVADGVMGVKTRAMLQKYQQDNSLPKGNLNIETLKSLGVNASN